MNVLYKQKEFKNIKNINISPYAQIKNPSGVLMNTKQLEAYISKHKPYFLINERSNGLKEHKAIEKICNKLNIFTICILDLYLGENRFDEIPNYLLVPSKSIEKELVDYGIDKDKIFVCGNPTFDSLENYKYNKSINRETPKILFVSQGKPTESKFDEIYKSINNTFKEFSIEVKLHPQEDEFSCFDYSKYKNTTIINHDNSTDFIPKCLEYDLVIGLESTIQIKANLMGIETIFIGYGLNVSKTLLDYKKGLKMPVYKYMDFEKDSVKKTTDKIFEIVKVKKNS